MRMSASFIQTLREAPGDARTPGYQFLTRAGYARSLGSGTFAWLPLGALAHRRLAGLVSAAFQAVGGQEVVLPLVQPAEQMLEPGDVASGSVRFRDRHHRIMALTAAKEGAVLALAAGVVQSYRQLPVLLYQIGPRYNDEASEVNDLVAAREGMVAAAFGLHADQADLAHGYQRVGETLTGIFAGAALAVQVVIADEDSNQRATAQRWLYPWPDGDHPYLLCEGCGYAAEQDVARMAKSQPEPEPLLPMQDVATPDCKTIADLAAYLGIPESRTAKAVFLVAGFPDGENRFIFAVVRGDTTLNEVKLKKALGATTLGFATEAEIRQVGAEPGYGSPVGLHGVTVVADELVALSPNLVAGANRPGYHTLNVNHGRDYQATLVADITLAEDGSACPMCGGRLVLLRGVELAASRMWGDRLSGAAQVTFLDREGHTQPLLLASYRLYLDRLIAAVAEQHHDAQGLRWPSAMAPLDVYLMTAGKATPEVVAAAEGLYQNLQAAGFSVLYDDRDERAGVKFNDADLIGLPWRVAVGERGLKAGMVEVKRRGAAEVLSVPVDELAAWMRSAA